jgi:cell division protein ZapA (FtsZ GTPase activity inhibitor)
VRSDRDEQYIDQLSRVVNEQFDDIRRNTRTISTHNVALLAALNLADELARAKEALAKAEERMSAEKNEMLQFKESLTKKAQATLQEVESALAFVPAEWRGRDG